VPLSFFASIGTASKKRILFKGGNSIEALTKVKAIVMDKTGTITLGNFVVQTLEPAAGVEEKSLLLTAAKCEKHSTHPIARSILTAAGENVESPTNVEEIAGKGVLADGVLCGSRGLLEVYGVEIPSLTAAPGCTEVLLAEQTGKYLGRILISDTVKPGAQKAISRLHQMGMTTVMLTGDGENSANAVAQQVGIQQVKAKLLPQEKLSALQDIRQQSGGVMFVGDGINDAPVLAGADVGAAMGSGADAAIEAADVVFMTNELGAIPEAIRIAKKTNVISKENVVFALIVKAFVLILGVLGLANMWFAVFADTGVALICIANSIRMLYQKN
jgi:Cd2+/Zn2+-exporting ATPase